MNDDKKENISDEELFECTPPDLTEESNAAVLNSLPDKSRARYEKQYKVFMK